MSSAATAVFDIQNDPLRLGETNEARLIADKIKELNTQIGLPQQTKFGFTFNSDIPGFGAGQMSSDGFLEIFDTPGIFYNNLSYPNNTTLGVQKTILLKFGISIVEFTNNYFATTPAFSDYSVPVYLIFFKNGYQPSTTFYPTNKLLKIYIGDLTYNLVADTVSMPTIEQIYTVSNLTDTQDFNNSDQASVLSSANYDYINNDINSIDFTLVRDISALTGNNYIHATEIYPTPSGNLYYIRQVLG